MSAATFDYLIVGAGTAGCVLAGRLAEDAGTTVCVLEAGGDERSFKVAVPALVAAAIGTPRLNWGFETVPQPALQGRRVPQPRGRVVGGSGSINGMAYHRGHPRDYDDWARAGAEGWDYAHVLPYFTRSEHNEDFPDSPFHGQDGPINVRRPRPENRLNHAFIASVRAAGFPAAADLTGPAPEGVGLRQGLLRGGRRESTARAYLRPALRTGRVDLRTGARVLRLLLEGRRVTGVEVEIAGQHQQLHARREVLLCAGAVQSPQVLLLSGIGPAEELRAAGVTPVVDVPGVGANLHDHLSCPVVMATDDATSYGLSARALPRGALHLLQYLLTRTGPLAGNVFESVAFLRTCAGLDRPDVQFVFQPAARPKPGFPLPVGHGFVINPVNLYPRSRGKLMLAGPDPHAAPLIDPALLHDPADLQPMLRALRLARRFLAGEPFARYRAHETLPGVAAQDDAALTDYIRSMAFTVHHQVGTCRMGNDAAAVVDPELRFRGLDGLRVVDASVMPSIVGGNTNAVVVMIAERAADLIRGRRLLAPAQAALQAT